MHLRRIFTFVSFAALAACGGRGGSVANTPGGPAPAAAVERFMRLIEEKDYIQMGHVFGTAEGTVLQRGDPPQQVQQRMYAIANVLDHERFAIKREEPIPGRMGSAVTLTVELTRAGRTWQVPFVAVRSRDVWLVEQVDLVRLTNDP